MKKYNIIQIIDNDGKTEYRGSYYNLLRKFNSKEECDEYIEDCKEKGYEYSSRTTYYEFEYNGEGLSNNWLEDIMSAVVYENSKEMIEGIIKKSFITITNVRCEYIGDYVLIVLPRKYDSLIMRRPKDIDVAFFKKLFREINLNIQGRHNKTNTAKIYVAEFVDNWRTKIPYADYNEGYRFYFNSIPKENNLIQLMR